MVKASAALEPQRRAVRCAHQQARNAARRPFDMADRRDAHAGALRRGEHARAMAHRRSETQFVVVAAGQGAVTITAAPSFSVSDLNGLAQTTLTLGDNAVTYDTVAPTLTRL